MLNSQTVNSFETPSNKENIIPNSSTIKNPNNLNMFCKDISKINELDETGWTPLYRTIIADDISSTLLLLNKGADPNIKCTMGETPLYQAVEMEKIEQIKLLLKKGADPNITNDDGLSPLHIAVNKQNISIVKLLLKYGANPNIKTKLYHQTPLHLAIKNNADPIFLLLLVQFNGSLMKEDKFNKKPVDYTNSKEMQSTIEKLKLGKDELKIEKIKEVEKFETPSKIFKITPNNIYSNTIRSKSKGKELVIGNNNAILQNPGNIKLTIIDGKNNIFSNDKNEISMNNKAKQIGEKKLFDLKDNENNVEIKNKENKENININENDLIKDEYNKSLKESVELEDLDLNNKEIDYSLLKKTTGKFGDELINNNNIDNINNNDNNNLVDSKALNNSLKQKSIKLNKNEIRLSDIDNKINNKKSIRFSFSLNTFKNNNEIKNSLSKSIEENKENINNENKKNINKNIESNNNKAEKKVQENEPKTFKKNINNNKNKKKVIIKKYFNKEEKGNIKDQKEILKDFDINNCLYEKIIKKSITKIEIYDDINESEKKSYTNTKSNIKSNNKNNDNTKEKSSIKSLYNRPILKQKKINNLKKILKKRGNNSSFSIKLEKKNIKTDDKNNKTKYKNLSFNEKISEKSEKENMNINIINSDNNKNKNIRIGSISRESLTTLTASGNEYLKNVNNKNNQSYNNKNNSFKSVNDTLINDKIRLSYLSNNVNSEISNEYILNNNNKYPIYEWLKEIGLHCYYNLFKEKKIFSMDKIITNLKTGKFMITKNEIEKIGIIIHGHIYRILIKLEIDSGKINSKISNYFLKEIKGLPKQEINILNNSVYLCYGCCASNERAFYNKIKKDFNLEHWLNKINMIKYKQNFLENGYDLFEYFFLQMFSSIPIDDYILKEELGIENDKDRDVILLRLNKDIKHIIVKIENQIKDEIYFKENKVNELDTQKDEKNSECIII